MKTHAQILCLIIPLLIISCSDDFDNKLVVAGKYDASFIYHEFLPPLTVEMKMDSLTNFYFGMDSIDFDFDGNFDANIVARFQLNDSTAKINDINEDSYFRIYMKNDYQLAVKDMPYSCGHGYCNYIPLICPMDYDTQLNNFPDWSDTKNTSILWLEPYNHWNLSWWTQIDSEEMYIGIRRKETGLKNKIYYKYGWIKVNALSLKNISFTSFAMND
jgi:hypothetical protein